MKKSELPKTKKQYLIELLIRNKDGRFPSVKYLDGTVVCAYRGNEGVCCAAGILIADEDYNDYFEKLPLQVNVTNYRDFARGENLRKAIINNIPEGMTISEIIGCQKCHDLTIQVVFGDTKKWSKEDFIKRLDDTEIFEDVWNDPEVVSLRNV